jgi:hypothetical protein
MPTWIVTLMFCCLLAAAPEAVTAGEKSIGRAVGEAGRAIVNDTRSAYEASKDLVVETGESVSEGAQEAYEEAQHIGPKMVEDVKKGFQGGGQAPDPIKETTAVAEKP